MIRTRLLERLDDLDLLALVFGVTRQRVDAFESTGLFPPLLDDEIVRLRQVMEQRRPRPLRAI